MTSSGRSGRVRCRRWNRALEPGNVTPGPRQPSRYSLAANPPQSQQALDFNLTGHPALTLPSGFDRHGVPTGVQLVGRWWADNELFRIGAQLERLAPWQAQRPPVD